MAKGRHHPFGHLGDNLDSCYPKQAVLNHASIEAQNRRIPNSIIHFQPIRRNHRRAWRGEL